MYSIYCILLVLLFFQFYFLICIYLNLCILHNCIILWWIRAYCACSLYIGLPLSSTIQNVWHIQPVFTQLWDSVYSQRICDCLVRGLFSVFIQCLSQRTDIYLSHMFNGPVHLQPGRELALLSTGFPLESQTDFWSTGFGFMRYNKIC